MQDIRKTITDESIPADIADIIMQSWRQITQKQYDVYLRKWTKFCTTRQINPVQPTVNSVLQFLHKLYTDDFSYSSINTARSALANYVMDKPLYLSKYTISTHPMISRFMKRIFNYRKSTPRYTETRDVDAVLRHLEQLPSVEQLTLKELSLKLVILLALTSGKRYQTLSLLNTEHMKKTENCFPFTLTGHVKQNRPDHTTSSFFVRKFSDKKLCLYTTLEAYLEVTKNLRKNYTNLLISFAKPHKPVGTSTIGRRIKTVLAACGIDTQ